MVDLVKQKDSSAVLSKIKELFSSKSDNNIIDILITKAVNEWNDNRHESMVKIGFGVVGFNFIFMLIQFVYVFYTLRIEALWLNPIYGVISILAPYALWIYSTVFDYFNFLKRKKRMLWLCILNSFLVLLRYCMEPFGMLVVPFCMKIWVDGFFFTEFMVVNLARFLIFIMELFVGYIMYSNAVSYLFDEEVDDRIKTFKILHHIDTRKNKDATYDINIMRDLETGDVMPIFEKDRYTHIVVDGSSGTGKTSSFLEPVFYNDLKIRVKNTEKKMKELYEFVSAGKGVCLVDTEEQTADYKNIVPKEQYEKEYRDIIEKYRDCGYCVIAPNNDITDKIKSLCEAHHVTCHVMDPMPYSDGTFRKDLAVLNPLFVSPNIPEWDIENVITSKAAMFSDIMQSVAEMKGKSDGYFISVNRTCTTNIAILLMCAYKYSPIYKGQHPTMVDVLKALNDFTLLEVYVNIVESQFAKPGVKPENQPYYLVTSYVRQTFLGGLSDKLSEHSSGLKIVLQEILNNPRMRRLLGGEGDYYIDFDDVLAKGDIVVINYALEMGETLSTTYGLMCVESLNQAILRRPGTEKDRIPFVLIIDELARLMTPSIEQGFTLYRQYRVSMIVAFQSLSQFERYENYKYLPKVLLTCGTHILFGRAGLEEMRIYSELAGKKNTTTTQKSVSQTSILDANPSFSMSERETSGETEVIKPIDIRKRDFQEVTVFTTRNNRVLEPMICKLNFLPKSAFDAIDIVEYDWNQYKTTIFIDDTLSIGLEGSGNSSEEISEIINETAKTYNDASAGVTVVTDDQVVSDRIDINNSKVTNVTDNRDYRYEEAESTISKEQDTLKEMGAVDDVKHVNQDITTDTDEQNAFFNYMMGE